MPQRSSVTEVRNALPEYNVEEHIDSGGFKDVYLAERGGKQVVVKIVPTELPSRLRRAKREAEAMLSIQSPNFVKLNDFFQAEIGGTQTVVLEEDYIEGPTLREKISDGGHGVELGIQVTETLLELLIEFDTLGIIHRDIKPTNIMIDSTGDVILLDVGLVRFEERDSVTPDHTMRLGTRRYAAPEQLDYDKDLQSIRIDIFSTGVVMFECFTGIHPYEESDKSTSDAIISGDKANLVDMIDPEAMALDLQEIFGQMTEPKPRLRYRKPSQAKKDWDNFREEHNV